MKTESIEPEVFETREIGVAGMTCDNCAGRVEKALRGVNGVNEVRVDRQAALARVTFDSNKTALPALHDAVRQSGYQPTIQLPE
jgi:P-type Cu+ transporter